MERLAREAGIISASDIDLLSRVFNRVISGAESDVERDDIAAGIVAAFLAGLVDEDELVAKVRAALERPGAA